MHCSDDWNLSKEKKVNEWHWFFSLLPAQLLLTDSFVGLEAVYYIEEIHLVVKPGTEVKNFDPLNSYPNSWD